MKKKKVFPVDFFFFLALYIVVYEKMSGTYYSHPANRKHFFI